MPKSSELCDCGHSYKQHRSKGGECLVMDYKGIDTEATGEKGETAIVDNGTICGCEKFHSRRAKVKVSKK
jgi:hypothetical protein